MAKPRLRMFAGPNGSGKSVFIEELRDSEIPLGPVVNADEIMKHLNARGFLDLSQFRLNNIHQEDWAKALKEIPEIRNRIKKISTLPNVQIRENTLICKDVDDAYHAALITDFLRYCLVQKKVSFSFETVMSHPAKIEFLKFASLKGYTTYLYYIATEAPEININRVENRVKKGGHDVPIQKIRDRYYRSLDLLFDALKAADRAYLLDNSKRRNSVIFEKKYDGRGYPSAENLPSWFYEYVHCKLI